MLGTVWEGGGGGQEVYRVWGGEVLWEGVSEEGLEGA